MYPGLRFAAIVLGCAAVVQLSCAQPPRPMQVQDLFELWQLGDRGITLSPQGGALLYELHRPIAASKSRKGWLSALGYDRSDVWVLTEESAAPQNLTQGVRDGSSSWSPMWSPDGQRAAFISTKGGGDPAVWVWERSSGAVRSLGGTARLDFFLPPTWVDATHLIYSLAPPDDLPPLAGDQEIGGLVRAMHAWTRYLSGETVTVSVIESGKDIAEGSAGHDHRLMLVDVTTGIQQTVARGWFVYPMLSPDRTRIALFKVDLMTRKDARDRLEPKLEGSLVVLAVDGQRTHLREFDDITIVSPAFPARDVAGWSPDGSRLAFLGRRAGEPEMQAFIFQVRRDEVVEVSHDGLQPTGEMALPARAGSRLQIALRAKGECRTDAAVEPCGRADWWLFSAGRKPKNLTSSLTETVTRFEPEAARASFIALAGGRLWRISPEGRAPERIASSLEAVRAIAWPHVSSGHVLGPEFIASTGESAQARFDAINLSTGRTLSVPLPAKGAELLDYSPERGTAVFKLHDRTGTYLWRAVLSDSAADGRVSAPLPLVRANMFLQQIAEGQWRSMSYTGLNGQALTAWILLPADYIPGRKYPTVAWVYAGRMMNEHQPPHAPLNHTQSLNLQLLAARGYAVLFPSMPVVGLDFEGGPENTASDSYLDLPIGVLPALDKAISLGITDPQRLAVMGQSFGGFSTYGLITQTRRFKAAIAMAGVTNWVSYYGQLDARFRYHDAHPYGPSGDYWRLSTVEQGLGAMGGPPWKDLERYLRNSPITYVERADTPLLIIHGDMDFVPIGQAEEFYNALFRQGKRVQFARYWGEGHVIGSPPNVTDMWRRIYAWLDESCDVARDARGELLWDGTRAKSRNGAPGH